MYNVKKEMKYVIAVSNRNLCENPFLEQVEIVCKKHPKAFLLREKDLTLKEYANLAEKVKNICDIYQVPCIIHSYPQVAEKLEISCLHLPLAMLRELSQQEKEKFVTLGTSVHSLEEVKEAEHLGASYLIAGHIYETDCKKGLPPRGLSFLQEICKKSSLPVYAIGGISPGSGQIQEVLKQKAAGACIMSEMMRQLQADV